MEVLEAGMKKHNINIDSTSSSSSSHGHAIYAYGFSSMQILLIISMSGLLIMEHIIIWIRIKPYVFL
jgi:hypothetical protein